MLDLDSLGTRIVVLGPSNAGKSTLAVALSRKLDIAAIHLDQFQHLPNTDWKPRPEAEFARLHDDAIMGERWVMDGNYSRLMPQRLARATGAILNRIQPLAPAGALYQANNGQSGRTRRPPGRRAG
ncbi:hypothetical protein [Martelella sp. AMO21009]